MPPDSPIGLTPKESLNAAESIDSELTSSSESPSNDYCKQLLFNLTPYVLIPATPARKTAEFFDSINNLDPIKFSPPDSHRTPTKKQMSVT